MDQEAALLFCGLWIILCWWVGGTVKLCLFPLQEVACKYVEVVAHVRWGKVFASQLWEPVTELVLILK